QPTRTQCGPHQRVPIWSCSEWGLPCHELLPVARCALTAPFYPYRRLRASAGCSLLHFPCSHTPRSVPGTLPCRSRTFLHITEAIQRLSSQLLNARVATLKPDGKPRWLKGGGL